MKTWKKLAAALFALALGAALMATPLVAYADVTYDDDIASALRSNTSVIDEDDLLDSNAVASLNEMGSKILAEYGVGAYYVTVDSLEDYSEAQKYTDDFVEAYGLENLTPGGCVVCLVCVPESQFALVSAGNALTAFSNDMLNHLVTEINPYLGRSDWAGAGETFFDDVRQTLSGKKANATSEVKYEGTYITDDCGLFSDNERMQLEADATAIAEQYKMGVYLLIVDYMQDSDGNDLANPTSSQRTNFATSFYRANNLGLGSGKDGIMLTLAVKSRDYVTIGFGQGSYSFSNEGITYMEDAVKDYLGDEDWFGGCDAYYSNIREQLEYYSVKGETWTEPDLLSLILKILAALGIPAGVAASTISREKAAMKTAHEQTEAQNYLVRDSFELTRSSDSFVNTTMTVAPIPRHEDSDSGGSGFGGGGWGGGGGGGFSSSGGGKF